MGGYFCNNFNCQSEPEGEDSAIDGLARGVHICLSPIGALGALLVGHQGEEVVFP